jgi:hypothetical protein
VSEAGRSSRYTQAEIDGLSFPGPPPDAAALAVRWKAMLTEAHEIIAALPTVEAGTCLLGADGTLFRGDRARIRTALASRTLRFHRGSIRGSVPRILDR